MAKIVVVTSGKGGVGKTTTSASFATGLALRGFKTVVIDFDVGLRNLDLIMGCENRLHNRLTPERIEKMKREILAVVNTYVSGVNIDDVNIQHHNEANMEVLEMNISLPDSTRQ